MLYIIRNRYFMIDYVFDRLTPREDVRVVELVRRRGGGAKWFRLFDLWLGRKASARYFDAEFLAQLDPIAEDDRVLFFGVENQKDLTLLRRRIPSRRVSVWLWNTLFSITQGTGSGGEGYVRALQRQGMRVCTFDRGDAARYGLEALEQVYARPAAEESEKPEVDLFFVGADKGREARIVELAERAEALGLSCDLRVVGGTSRWAAEGLPYAETLRCIGRCRALLDVPQQGQGGSTLRPLEALFMGKKLVTTDAAVRQAPFYDPRYVFVVGEDRWEELASFVRSEVPPLPAERLERHEINRWIEQF